MFSSLLDRYRTYIVAAVQFASDEQDDFIQLLREELDSTETRKVFCGHIGTILGRNFILRTPVNFDRLTLYRIISFLYL